MKNKYYWIPVWRNSEDKLEGLWPDEYTCSCCLDSVYDAIDYKYCPHCGAKMSGIKEDAEWKKIREQNK